MVHGNYFYFSVFSSPPGYDLKRSNLYLDVSYLRLRCLDFSFEQTAPKKAGLVPGIHLHEHDFFHRIPHRQAVNQTQSVSLGLQ